MGNQKLENMLDEMRARTSEKKLPDDFIAMLKESDVIVPAIMPAGTDPEILHKLMEYSDKNMGLPPEANPQPCVLQNPGPGRNIYRYLHQKSRCGMHRKNQNFHF